MREKIITGTRDDGEKTGPMAKARRWAGGHVPASNGAHGQLLITQ